MIDHGAATGQDHLSLDTLWGSPFRDRIGSCNEQLLLGLVSDLTRWGHLTGSLENAIARALVKLGGDIVDGGRTVVVEDLVGAQALDITEVTGGASGDDFKTGGFGQLNGVAANT